MIRCIGSCSHLFVAHDLRANALRLSRGKTGFHFSGSCAKTPASPLGKERLVSEAIEDLVGPEPLEPVQRLVQGREFLVRDAADLLHGLDVLLIERFDDAADFLALRGEADADRAAIDARALM